MSTITKSLAGAGTGDRRNKSTRAKKDASDSITSAYTYDLSGQLISVYNSGNTYYYHQNRRGDIIRITNQNKNVVASYSYDPWGNILDSTGTFSNSQPFRYAGYLWDPETSLYFLSARYYDPSVGRFISRDPDDIGDVTPQINPYLYAEGNPVSYIDPSGLLSVKGYLDNLRYLGYNLTDSNKLNRKNRKAIKEFQRTHTRAGDITKKLKVNGELDTYTKGSILYWRDKGQLAQNNFFMSTDNWTGTKLVAVYAYIDDDFVNTWKSGLSGQAAKGYAPGMAMARYLFNRVNTKSKFPGGPKFRAYNIELKNVAGIPSKRVEKYNNLLKPAGYELRVAFNGHIYQSIAGYAFVWGDTTVIYGQSGSKPFARDRLWGTLTHELGHIFGAKHCNYKTTEKYKGWPKTGCKGEGCCPNGHDSGDCVMYEKIVWMDPKWCSVHQASVKKGVSQKGW